MDVNVVKVVDSFMLVVIFMFNMVGLKVFIKLI